ncbi:NAD+ synthase [Luteibaculum oceani]|uniref:Glutamine-dependent NAD(+) synthetase n=1 Tax=Luteibaculum oceani TaxID=1294296 RepID=A0A5C6V517_9FLAO|nr:NAD+ synthase [Luteibaculum oceani]TXC78888.1 NAD+ synthase [Luteibaculum oceani]
MKFALAQLNFHIGNFTENRNKIIENIKKAKGEGADVVLFPELAISGYPARDFLDFDHFVQCCLGEMETIAKECIGITAIVGGPDFNKDSRGKDLKNSAFVLADGKIQSKHQKMLLPNYDVFDEYRYFEPSKSVYPTEINGETWAITICEDIWDLKPDSQYAIHPLEELFRKSKIMGVINIASSPFSDVQREERLETVKAVYDQYKVPVIYVNQVGAQTELIFDGGSCVINENGKLIEGPYFKEQLLFWENKSDRFSNFEEEKQIERIERIHQGLLLGIKDYFRKLGFKSAILGLSGGIDSAVTLALAVEALGKENVTAVLMPSEFSSDHSVSDSEEMVNILGCNSYKLPIKEGYHALLGTLKEPFSETDFGLAEENLQARIRGVLLMAISNKQGQILLNTSNKSEIAVGFGTLYGDMCGGISVIGDVYKTDVYRLARHLNKNGVVIPENIITKAPSAELRPDQLDSDRLPDYDTLDSILKLYIEETQDINAIIRALTETDEATIRKTLKLVNINEYKRHQTPPILRVTKKAFGQGRRMPIVAKYLG